MEDMKSDMTGAAVVAAAMQAIARLGLPVNVVGYLALTENMTGGKAMKMGDVLTMRNGKTVEIMNTDAEGRLILADALAYAVEQQPARVLDLATLTGACIVALGLKVAGLFGNNDAFCKDLAAACRKTGERVWRLPLYDDFKEQLKSSVADLKNVGGKWGGAVDGGQVSRAIRGLDAVDSPRYRRPELVRYRKLHPRRRRDRLLRPIAGGVRRETGLHLKRSPTAKRRVTGSVRPRSQHPAHRSQLQMLEQPFDRFESRDVECSRRPSRRRDADGRRR